MSSSQLTNSYFSEGLKPPTSYYTYENISSTPWTAPPSRCALMLSCRWEIQNLMSEQTAGCNAKKRCAFFNMCKRGSMCRFAQWRRAWELCVGTSKLRVSVCLCCVSSVCLCRVWYIVFWILLVSWLRFNKLSSWQLSSKCSRPENWLSLARTRADQKWDAELLWLVHT